MRQQQTGDPTCVQTRDAEAGTTKPPPRGTTRELATPRRAPGTRNPRRPPPACALSSSLPRRNPRAFRGEESRVSDGRSEGRGERVGRRRKPAAAAAEAAEEVGAASGARRGRPACVLTIYVIVCCDMQVTPSDSWGSFYGYRCHVQQLPT
ncbi:hypothetical protein EUGRSUZ_B00252 [Eucalyptus grandis]|uniref:Uncharacterized protein n=2 Tax=Eucalyptus grandis TaxID=71139 RepID=A0ACC3LLL8_EUCGR|nr:hypothetical protein EUGRSUZ_B00252 [Eucalyptus grandis]